MRIPCCLAFVRFTKADDPNPVGCFGKDQRVHTTAQQPQRRGTHFGAGFAVVKPEECRLKFEVHSPLETQAPRLNVACVFGGVVCDFHSIYCMHIKMRCQSSSGLALANRNPQYETGNTYLLAAGDGWPVWFCAGVAVLTAGSHTGFFVHVRTMSYCSCV